jgi:ParB-like chromosome segregation protein Spo0J
MAKQMTTVTQKLTDLVAHPDNYRSHPPEQIEHIKHSLQKLGQYKPVVVTPEMRILAGHGVVEAARELGWKTVTVHVFDGDEPLQRLLMIADNEIQTGAMDDERALTELLRELNTDIGLDGTGYDEQMLAALVLVTRTEEEIPDFDAAAEWVGMPSMGEEEREVRYQLIVWCDSPEERQQAMDILGVDVVGGNRNTVSAHWPVRERALRADSSLRYVEDD